jgi:hypothetical protein
MISNRRNFMEIAAWGTACFPAIASASAQEAEAQAQGVDSPRPGDVFAGHDRAIGARLINKRDGENDRARKQG